MVSPTQNGISMKKKSTLVFPNIPSAIRSVPHDAGLPFPEPPDNFAMYSDDEDSVLSNSEEQQLQEMQTTCQAQTPPIIRSHKASSMTSSRISNFQKNKAECLASRLQQWNLLHHKGKWCAAMLGDCCWMMRRDAFKTKNHRQAKWTSR